MYSSAIRSSRALPASLRFFHASPAVALQPSFALKDFHLSQGTSSRPGRDHPRDPHDQAARAGQRIRSGMQASGPCDAASFATGKRASGIDYGGNPEGVGFAEQVGGASAAASEGGPHPAARAKGGKEESTPSELLTSIKNKLGLSTSTDEVKQKRSRGSGGTGTARPNRGKVNASEHPKLPSYQLGLAESRSGAKQKRHFSTSARSSAVNHTTETYSKDVDITPPASQKVHQVDSSTNGPDVQRPTEPLTGEWSRAGAKTKEYETVSQTNPYDIQQSSELEAEQKLRYGGMPRDEPSSSKDQKVSKPDEGPSGSSRGGRKPEGRA